jgi:hypothetical protein
VKKARIDPTTHQAALKARHKLSDKQFREMLEMLAQLTPAERATLKDPDFITEDEADILVSDRRMKEPGKWISAEELFAETGHIPRHRRSA